jgi:hypothetical protein
VETRKATDIFAKNLKPVDYATVSNTFDGGDDEMEAPKLKMSLFQKLVQHAKKATGLGI